ncbi:hypothetical protein Patl1_34681 [Pistacia atlantica]|uniref:Uncharacterized protein n=1 Tax=Pistacia atlantica TaxID=434234 RepID=A0ACC0ZS63_9ROSI|nr:hypothetical protein Patl1_34681 [Pistacia atlantica]
MGKAPDSDIFTATVHVQNNWGGGIHLTTHCQSGDDDLDERPREWEVYTSDILNFIPKTKG